MLENLDLFGKKVEFKFNGKGTHKSIIGGLSTLILVIIFVLALMYFGQDIILRRAPKTVMSNLVTESPEEVLISPSTFNFAFGLQNPENFIPFMDENVYTVQVTYNRVKKEVQSDESIKAVITQVSLETEKCTLQHFGDASSQFSKLQLNQLYCLKNSQANLDSLTVRGDKDSSIYEFINVELTECDDQDNSMSCAPKASRDQLLKNGIFNLYFTNMAIDPKNYEQPNRSYKASYFTKISYNITKEIQMWVGHTDIVTDSGWLLDNKKNESLTKYSRMQELLSFNGDSNQLVNLVIQSESIRTQYERTYVKIQNIMAAVDGIIPMGLIAIFIFVSPYSRIKFYETLINELFDIKEFDSTEKVRKRKKKNTRKKKKDLIVKTTNELEKKKKLSEPPKLGIASPIINHQTDLEKLQEPVLTGADLLPEFFNQANV